MLMLVFTILGAYGLASIPFGLVIARVMGLGDLRQIGSGNIGATNVLRTGNKLAAFLTLILDIGKGAVAVLIVAHLTDDPMLTSVAAVASVIGHCFPVWLGFKGGKGVATGIGVIIALHPLSGLAMIGAWLLTAAVMRISSLAAIVSYGLTPLILYSLAPEGSRASFTAAAVVIAMIAIGRHHSNLKRLLNGTEPRIGK
jgi:glycerol-3-phosphate acyltransferase PlsY